MHIDPKFVFLYFRDPSEMVRPRVAMSACIEAFASPEVVDDFYSTALRAKSVAQKLVNCIAIFKDVYRPNLYPLRPNSYQPVKFLLVISMLIQPLRL